jgi:hypothetical protein
MAIKQKSSYWLKLVATVLALTGISYTALPSGATRYRPPQNFQRPEGRQGGATRSGCVSENFIFEPIIPTSNYGQTTVDYPTFYWYLSNHKFAWARFELYATLTPTADDTPEYSKTLQLTQEDSLKSVTLPQDEGLKALEVNRDYLWKVTLICSKLGPDDDSADGSQISVQGSITRVAPPLSLQGKLNGNTPAHDTYAEEGLWYDAISNLALKRQSQPQSPQLNRDWCDLIKETRLSNQLCQ